MIKELAKFGEMFLWVLLCICLFVFLYVLIFGVKKSDNAFTCGRNGNIYINCNGDSDVDMYLNMTGK